MLKCFRSSRSMLKIFSILNLSHFRLYIVSSQLPIKHIAQNIIFLIFCGDVWGDGGDGLWV